MAKNKPLNKMPVSERAKQFTPFAAVKGLTEALASKEKIRVSKSELSDDRMEEIDIALKTITSGQIITVVYYYDEEYIQLTGILTKVDEKRRMLIVITTEIPFEDIYDIIL